MRGWERLTRCPRPGLLLLVVVTVAATASPSSIATDDASAPPSALTTQAPPTPTSAPVSPTPERAATTPPQPAATTTTEVTPTMGAATPVRLQIPAIGVDSELMELGLETDGTLQVPPTGFPAGWYTGAPTPGELGPSIIAGHVDWGGRPGVFFDLRELSSGDEIAVVRQDGSTARFRVDRVDRFAKAEFPTQLVYADIDHAGLRLITCGGEFDREARSYEDNLVVFARLVEEGSVVQQAHGAPPQ